MNDLLEYLVPKKAMLANFFQDDDEEELYEEIKQDALKVSVPQIHRT